MNKYNLIFNLYGGVKTFIESADTEQEAIQKVIDNNPYLPLKFKKAIQL